MKKIFKYKRAYLLFLLPLGFILTVVSMLSTDFLEGFLYPFVYKPIRKCVGSVFSIFPFSLSEWLIIFIAFFVLSYIGYSVYKFIKNKEKRAHITKLFILNSAVFISVIYFLFVITMGICYYRPSIVYNFDFSVEKYSKQDLYNVLEILAGEINIYRKNASSDFTKELKLNDENFYKTSNEAVSCYKKLSLKYSFVGDATIKNKPMVFSKVMSSFLTTGVYFPITFESNINVDVPQFTIPMTMCHELCHANGIMREDEANFIGFLACMESDRYDFKYSAAKNAFDYCLNALAGDDVELAGKIANMVNEGVVIDSRAENEYWKKYQKTTVSKISNEVYDSYLKANGVESGIKSYGKMVDLIVAYYLNRTSF